MAASVSTDASCPKGTLSSCEERFSPGILGHCIGNLLLDPTVWLSSVEDEITVEVCIQEETLNLIYKGILMQEGSFFGRCSANQIFDSSTSGEDLYLEQGDLAQFEPPFLGSDWTVRSLTDGARGTSPKPALEPVIPFHQWFLTSSAESLLIGSGKPACHFPLEFASGLCLATEEYNAEGPDELTLAPGDHILIVGFLVSCFDWFTGMMEKTGQVGLIKTSLVKPFVETLNSADILLDGEEGKFACPQDQSIIKESIESLKKTFENDAGLNYKLDIIPSHNNGAKPSGQLSATRHLCSLYGRESPDLARCIIYGKHQAHILRQSRDRAQEAGALEAVSQLYLGLGTCRAYRTALDYTKRSLGIFIDLGCKEKETYGWLKAGHIYHLLGQTELVDIYIQAAQDVALSTGDTSFILKLLEASGDLFYSCQDSDRAITFYRDRAHPVAVKSGDVHCRLRLCNKLAQVMLQLGMYEEAAKFAQTAVDISINLGDDLNQRVACCRLASLYRSLQQYELAEYFYLKTLSLCPTPLQFDEETLFYVRVYQTLGDITFYQLKDPFDAAGYYQLALAAAVDLGNKRAQLRLCTRLATIYHNFLMERELSLFFYQKARGITTELNERRMTISSEQRVTS